MSLQKISERANYSTYSSTPTKTAYKNDYWISEWKLGSFGLFISLVVVTTKLYFLNSEYVHDLMFERKLISLDTVTENGEVMFTYMRKESLKYSKYWLPILCGLLSMYFTWLMVYLDSEVPGVQPPSPLSPSKYKRQSGHSFHLNYIFALLVGVLVFLYTSWKGLSL